MSDQTLPFTPLIIIGAGRSGTNILRDTLTSLSGFETWPCDEINPIWRHGNLFWPDDEIPVERADAGVLVGPVTRHAALPLDGARTREERRVAARTWRCRGSAAAACSAEAKR